MTQNADAVIYLVIFNSTDFLLWNLKVLKKIAVECNVFADYKIKVDNMRATQT